MREVSPREAAAYDALAAIASFVRRRSSVYQREVGKAFRSLFLEIVSFHECEKVSISDASLAPPV
jgi:hypothetical protein